MTAGKGPLRFSRKPRLQVTPIADPKPKRWHRSAREDAKLGQYRQLTALCGYTVAPSIALFLGYDLSRAAKPKGELCEKCEAVAKDEADYAIRHPFDPIKKKEASNGQH